jgi:serine/threonine protein kinase
MIKRRGMSKKLHENLDNEIQVVQACDSPYIVGLIDI